MAEQEQSRSEPATPFKREEARRRGFVSKSAELNSFLVIAASLAVMALAGAGIVGKQLRLDQAILSAGSGALLEAPQVVAWLGDIVAQTLSHIAPFFLAAVLVGALGSLVQTGPVFTAFPLQPDFDRINPANGLKRLFSLRVLFELGKNLVKLALFGAIVYFVLVGLLPALLALSQVDPAAYPAKLRDLIVDLGFKLALAMLFIALIDVLYSRWEYGNNLMMSRRELKDEIKRREGDPRVKARVRELQRELLKKSKSLSRVKDADVLITNPTHIAVALSYNRDEMAAPSVVAKGAGELAEKMRVIARRYRVPVFQNAPLARALFRTVEMEREIPEKHYAEVARILAWAYTLRGARTERG